MLTQDICYLYDSIAVYAEYGGIVFAEEEGKNIARALGEKNKVRPSPHSLIQNIDLTNLGRDPTEPRARLNRQHRRRSGLPLRASRPRLRHPAPSRSRACRQSGTDEAHRDR
jgi:hypothetical protein